MNVHSEVILFFFVVFLVIHLLLISVYLMLFFKKYLFIYLFVLFIYLLIYFYFYFLDGPTACSRPRSSIHGGAPMACAKWPRFFLYRVGCARVLVVLASFESLGILKTLSKKRFRFP